MKNIPKPNPKKLKSNFTYLTIVMFLFIGSCRKDPMLQPEIKKSVLSANLPDYVSRLNEIKKTFYQKKLDEKLTPKSDRNLSWEPDWNNPRSEVVNDTVSYVFYPLVGYLLKDGKHEIAKVVGAKPYLIVKNENEFYKGLYYQPNEERSDKQKPRNEINMDRFTGNLLLTNLEKKDAYLLHYRNGVVMKTESQDVGSLQKQMSIDGKTSYWETQCHTEIRSCTYYTYMATCGGGIVIEYSFYCQQPTYCQNSIWILSDYSVDEVCDQVWFPDPPIDPGDGSGNGGGGEDEGYVNLEDPGDKYELLVIADAINLTKKFECFNSVPDNASTTYSAKIYAELADASRPGSLLNPGLKPGHTFITMTKTNGINTVSETFGFYPESATKATSQTYVKSMIVNNELHPQDASLTIMINGAQFTAMMNKAIENAQKDYHMTKYSCTNFALEVFNVGMLTPLYVPNNVGIITGKDYGKTPTGMYEVIKAKKENGDNRATVSKGTGIRSTNCN